MMEGKTHSSQCTAYGPRQKTTFGECGRGTVCRDSLPAHSPELAPSPSPSLEKVIKKVAAHGAPPTFKKGLEQSRRAVPLPHSARR